MDADLARGAAKPSAADNADLDRHFAIGMQETGAQFAADRLSQGRTEPSGAGSSLDASEKRFKALVSRLAASPIVVSQPSDAASAAGDAGASATSDQVHKAYADA